jgi:hypothetical protein
LKTCTHVRIRAPQKLSREKIAALAGPTPIKAGEETIGILVLLRMANVDRLGAALQRAEALCKGRDGASNDRALWALGDVDPIDWNEAAVDALLRDWKRSR